jgi:hypothetical protein
LEYSQKIKRLLATESVIVVGIGDCEAARTRRDHAYKQLRATIGNLQHKHSVGVGGIRRNGDRCSDLEASLPYFTSALLNAEILFLPFKSSDIAIFASVMRTGSTGQTTLIFFRSQNPGRYDVYGRAFPWEGMGERSAAVVAQGCQ